MISHLISVGFLREVVAKDYTRGRVSNTLLVNDTQRFTRSVNQIRALALRNGYNIESETIFDNVVIYIQGSVRPNVKIKFTRINIGNGIIHYYAEYDEKECNCILL